MVLIFHSRYPYFYFYKIQYKAPATTGTLKLSSTAIGKASTIAENKDTKKAFHKPRKGKSTKKVEKKKAIVPSRLLFPIFVLPYLIPTKLAKASPTASTTTDTIAGSFPKSKNTRNIPRFAHKA